MVLFFPLTLCCTSSLISVGCVVGRRFSLCEIGVNGVFDDQQYCIILSAGTLRESELCVVFFSVKNSVVGQLINWR